MRFLLPLLLILFAGTCGRAQPPVTNPLVPPAPVDKAVVYIVRPSSLGDLINFRLYDGDRVIGRINGYQYVRYECEPGEHTFWARSENRSYVRATLNAGEIYVLETLSVMGALRARVVLAPLRPDEDGILPKRICKIIARRAPESFTERQLAEWQERWAEATERGTERLEDLDDKDRDLAAVDASYAVEPLSFRWVPKRRRE